MSIEKEFKTDLFGHPTDQLDTIEPAQPEAAEIKLENIFDAVSSHFTQSECSIEGNEISIKSNGITSVFVVDIDRRVIARDRSKSFDLFLADPDAHWSETGERSQDDSDAIHNERKRTLQKLAKVVAAEADQANAEIEFTDEVIDDQDHMPLAA